MRTAVRYKIIIALMAFVILALAAALMVLLIGPKEVDPHEGQVYIYDGFDWIWMTPLEGVEPNPLTERTRQRVDYDPKRDHDYSQEQPSMVEVEEGHFVYCSPSELEKFRAEIAASK